MSEITVKIRDQRSMATVTAEILTIKRTAQSQLLSAVIQIGERLNEAKSLCDHGEWSRWLKEEVEFSQATANNYMRLANEAAVGNLDSGDGKSQTLGNLSYSKAIKLLAVPEEDRAELMENQDVESMSTRELDKAIKEAKAAKAAKEAADKAAKDAKAAAAAAKKAGEKAEVEAKALKAQLATAADDQRAAVQAAKDEAAKDAQSQYQAELDRLNRDLADAQKAVADSKKQRSMDQADVAAFNAIFLQVQNGVNLCFGYAARLNAHQDPLADKLLTAMAALAKNIADRAGGVDG